MGPNPGRWMLATSAGAWLIGAMSVIGPTHAQDRPGERREERLARPHCSDPGGNPGGDPDGSNRLRCDGKQGRWISSVERYDKWRRRERERERKRRKDTKTSDVVAGAVGIVVVGGIIAAIVRKKKKARER
jgi:hypothetical protein